MHVLQFVLFEVFQSFFDHSPYATFNGKGKPISLLHTMTMLQFLSSRYNVFYRNADYNTNFTKA